MSEFFFDDFFVDDKDAGIEIQVEMRGEMVPIRIKRNLTLEDVEASKEMALRKQINIKTGEMELLGFDNAVFTLEALYRCIKSWPFKYRNGKPVPITRETVKAMCAEGAENLNKIIGNIISQRGEQVAPLGKNSGDRS